MSDDEKKQQAKSGVAEPEPAQLNTIEQIKEVESRPEAEQTREAALDQAKKFLQDPETQKATPEKKTEFLKSKGLSEVDIQQLLKEVSQDAPPAPPAAATAAKEEATTEQPTAAALPRKEDRPPIVTYPEFLTKPTRPPPLMTVNGFLNTLYAFGGLSTVIYGTSKYLFEPMVSSLTEARISLHDTARDDATKLVAKLEQTVSEIPVYKTQQHMDDDAVSHYDDPAELSHRDIGVQTSPPGSALASPGLSTESAATLHTRRLREITSSLKQVSEGLVSQTEGYADVKIVLDVFQDELDVLKASQTTDFVGGYSLYGAASKHEPDDEIKKAKENIRRVKGVLLSTRSFPGSPAVR